MKILFLDIEGVLNSSSWYMRRRTLNFVPRKIVDQMIYEIDPEALARLRRIVEATGCELVISSTWRRIYKMVQFREAFNHFGWVQVPFADKTPVLQQGIRGDEVRAWLNTTGKIMDVERYCCVDDNSDFHPDNNLFQTSHDKGLTDEVADSIINFLNQDLQTDQIKGNP